MRLKNNNSSILYSIFDMFDVSKKRERELKMMRNEMR